MTEIASESRCAATSDPSTGALPLLAICLGFFIVMLDTTIVNVALPSIGDDLDGDLGLLQWVVDSYTLVFAALLLSAGAAGDRFGPRRVYIAGLASFAVFSVLCAAAPSGGVLIAARALQGLGAAALVPGSLALITATYPDRAARARAIGVWGGMGGVAAALGPVVGGGLIAATGWQAVFLVNVPVAALAYVLVTRVVANPSPRRQRDFDLPGQVLAIAALACLTYAIIEGAGRGGWDAADSVVFTIGLALGAIFVAVESRRHDPMLPVRLFRGAAFATASATGVLLNFGFYGQFFVLTLYFQQLRGLSALIAGLYTVPQAMGAVLGSPLGGRVCARIGAPKTMTIGLLTGGAGYLGLLAVGQHTAYAVIAPIIFVAGFGMAIAMPAATAAAIAAVPPQRAGIAAGVINAARQLGSVLGVAILGAFVTTGTFLTGFHTAVAVAAAIFAVGAALNVIQIVRMSRARATARGHGLVGG